MISFSFTHKLFLTPARIWFLMPGRHHSRGSRLQKASLLHLSISAKLPFFPPDRSCFDANLEAKRQFGSELPHNDGIFYGRGVELIATKPIRPQAKLCSIQMAPLIGLDRRNVALQLLLSDPLSSFKRDSSIDSLNYFQNTKRELQLFFCIIKSRPSNWPSLLRMTQTLVISCSMGHGAIFFVNFMRCTTALLQSSVTVVFQ